MSAGWITRRGTILGLTSLAACGAPNRPQPPAPAGVLFAPRFEDSDPIRFPAPRPQRFPVQGIDAARFQTNIDWHTARANGVNFAFLKATEGGDLLDPAFRMHDRGARRAGVRTSAYHFYYFCTEPEVQARWFIRNVARRAGDLPPILDMEWNAKSPTCANVRPSPGDVRSLMRRWLSPVAAHFGQRPILYTTPDFYAQNRLDLFSGYEFWLRSTARHVAEVYPGQNWRFWQYSATGQIDGIAGNVDLNAFNGSQDDWRTWVQARTIR